MQKDGRFNLRVPLELKRKFELWCQIHDTTPSDELRRHMEMMIKKAEPDWFERARRQVLNSDKAKD